MREVLLLVEADHAEPLADALLAAGALSVSIEDADAGAATEQPLFGEPGLEPQRHAWEHNHVVVLLDDGVDANALAAAACAALDIAPLPIAAARDVAAQDWVRLTQTQFTPTRIGHRLWIVPSWHTPPADPAAVVMRLDPGVAFGTGTHATTRLCLQWLEANLPPEARVLDYGCGSGILAIAAALLGARDVAGTDIDSQALAAAQANASANGVGGNYTAPERLPPGPFDVVLANILTNPLQVLAPVLLARVAPGGALVLSGVLERQAQAVIEAYAAVDAGVPLSVWRSDEGWVCLTGVRARSRQARPRPGAQDRPA
jgi:ribosomal protein L11 methyltransferase